jgi:hypothetical protein
MAQAGQGPVGSLRSYRLDSTIRWFGSQPPYRLCTASQATSGPRVLPYHGAHRPLISIPGL